MNFYKPRPEHEKTLWFKVISYLFSNSSWESTGRVAIWQWKEGNNCYTQKGHIRDDGLVRSEDLLGKIDCIFVPDGSYQGKIDPLTHKLHGHTYDGNYWRAN